MTSPISSCMIINAMRSQGIIAGLAADKNKLVIAATEMTKDEDIEALAQALEEALA